MDDKVMIGLIIFAAIVVSSILGSIVKNVFTLAIPLIILYLTYKNYNSMENCKNLTDEDKKKLKENNITIFALLGVWLLILTLVNLSKLKQLFFSSS